MTTRIDISTDTGKLIQALHGAFPTTREAQSAAAYTADALKPMNAQLAGRFQRAAKRLTEPDVIAYLEPVRGDSALALQRAVQGFQRREGCDPEWAAVGEGVTLSTDALKRLGLRHQPNSNVQPRCIMVGIGGPEKDNKR